MFTARREEIHDLYLPLQVGIIKVEVKANEMFQWNESSMKLCCCDKARGRISC